MYFDVVCLFDAGSQELELVRNEQPAEVEEHLRDLRYA